MKLDASLAHRRLGSGQTVHKPGGRNALLPGSLNGRPVLQAVSLQICAAKSDIHCWPCRDTLRTERPLTSKREPRGRARPRVSHRLVHWLTLIFLSVGEYAVFYVTYSELYLCCREHDRLWQVKEYSALDAESPKAEFALCSCRIHVKTA